MSVKERSAEMSRRGFLKGTAMLGGAAAATTLSQTVIADVAAEAPVEKQEDDKGYHVTRHILDYYEKARF